MLRRTALGLPVSSHQKKNGSTFWVENGLGWLAVTSLLSVMLVAVPALAQDVVSESEAAATVPSDDVGNDTDDNTNGDAKPAGIPVPPDAIKPAGKLDPGQADLDDAVIARISAESKKEMESVIALLESALVKGLSEENKTFAKKMLGSVLLQRSQEIAGEMIRSRGRGAAKLRDEALESLEAAVSHDDSLVEAYLLIARFNMLPGGDRDAVTEAATKAIELLADNPTEQSNAYLLRASTYGDDQDDERMADLDAAIKANEDNTDALQMRAALRLSLQEIDGAIEDLEKILSIDPTNQKVAEAAVQQLVENNRVEDALGLITKTLEAKPHEGLLRMRGILYRMVPGKEAEALADFNKALAMQPRDPMSLLQRAEIALAREDILSAKSDLKAASKLAPQIYELNQALYVRCLIAIQEGRKADAIRDMETLVVKADSNEARRAWQVQLANLYINDDRPRKAVDLASTVLDHDPKNADALQVRGDALLAVGDHKEAIEDYERALKIVEKDKDFSNSKLSGVLNNLAWVLATSPQDDVRDGKRAVELAERAAELTDESQPHVLSTVGAAYAEAGDMEKAIQWSTKAVELGRKNDHEQLDQLQQELDSYKAGKPWREKQETKENAVPIIPIDDLIDT